jgi:hypothetical protein
LAFGAFFVSSRPLRALRLGFLFHFLLASLRLCTRHWLLTHLWL